MTLAMHAVCLYIQVFEGPIMKRTYQTRFDVTDVQGEYLERYASL